MTDLRRFLPPLVLVVALVALGCSGASGPAASAVGGASASVPAMTVQPTATTAVTAEPSAVAAASASSPPPAKGEHVAIDDPDLTMTLPAGWKSIPIADFRDLVAGSFQGATGPVKAEIDGRLQDMDSGAMRVAASGPSGFAPWSGTMTLQVDAGDASLDAAASRVEKREAALEEPTTIQRRPVALAIGDAIRIETTHALGPDSPAGSVPSRLIQYVVRLADGRTLWVLATGPEAAEGFGDMIDASVNTLAAS